MKNTQRQVKAAASLIEAEQNYLLANGWKNAKTINGIVKKWKAPKFSNVRYWDGVFPGDVLFHDSAIETQKSFDKEFNE